MKISKDDLQASLGERLAQFHVPGASVALYHSGELVTAAAGITNVSSGVKLTPSTLMHIGSITKVFTATLVMQLVDEAKIDLDEHVLCYLPDLRLRDRDALERITVKMLLNHTSGIDGEALPNYGHDEETIEKGIARFAELEQLFAPGTECSYSNAATVIAGYLVQRLSRRSWYELVRERIFKPLQMEHAATLPEEALLHRSSVGHFLDAATKKSVRTSVAFLPLSFAPCGTTLMMSARDLVTFSRAHLGLGMAENGNRILSAHGAKAMQQMTVNNQGKGYTCNLDMGMGWMLYKGLLTHSGGGPGIVSALYTDPERDWTMAILTNSDYGSALINELAEPWLREISNVTPVGTDRVDLPSKTLSIDSHRYIGVYEDLWSRYRVSETATGLALSIQAKHAFYDSVTTQATPSIDLAPLGDDRFLLARFPVGREGKTADVPDASRLFVFRNPDAQGCMGHLGWNLRLYKRVS
jgi:CubicO group peptidase (beta-lactamase class C family)